MSREAGAGTRDTFYSVLRHADFRRLWGGQVISNIGDSFTMMAQLVLVNRLTGSTLALAGMAIALALPQLVFGLLAGVFVDRLDRRKLMIAADVLRAVLVLPMVLVTHADQVWIFYLCGFAMASVATLFDPAKSALLPHLVPEDDLLRTNALSQTTRMVALLVGPMLAGLVLEAGTAALAFLLDAVSFAVSALAIWRIRTRVAPAVRAAADAAGVGLRGVTAEARAGLRAVFGTRTIGTLAGVFAVAMLGLGAINVLAIAFLSRNFGVGPGSLGLLMAVQAVGMILGSIGAGQWLGRAQPGRVLGGSLAVLGGGIVALAFAPTYAVVLALMFVIGLADGPLNAVAATLIQTGVSDAQRGRVGAGINTVITSANLLSMSLAGLAGDALGVSNVFILGGLITLLAGGGAFALLRDQVVGGGRQSAVGSGSPAVAGE